MINKILITTILNVGLLVFFQKAAAVEFTELDADCLSNIASFLPVKDQLSLSQVNRFARRVIFDSHPDFFISHGRVTPEKWTTEKETSFSQGFAKHGKCNSDKWGLAEWQAFFIQHPNLITLDANRCTLGEHIGQVNLPQSLRCLVLYGTCINNGGLEKLATCPNLTHLHLGGCYGITDFTPLARMVQLKWLNIAQTTAKTLYFLHNLTQLEYLAIWGTAIDNDDLTNIVFLTALTFLSIESCRDITDLAPLTTLENLIRLNIAHCNRITDLGPLSNMNKLEVINIAFTNVDGQRNRQLLLNLPSLTDVFTTNTGYVSCNSTISVNGTGYSGKIMHYVHRDEHICTEQLMNTGKTKVPPLIKILTW